MGALHLLCGRGHAFWPEAVCELLQEGDDVGVEEEPCRRDAPRETQAGALMVERLGQEAATPHQLPHEHQLLRAPRRRGVSLLRRLQGTSSVVLSELPQHLPPHAGVGVGADLLHEEMQRIAVELGGQQGQVAQGLHQRLTSCSLRRHGAPRQDQRVQSATQPLQHQTGRPAEAPDVFFECADGPHAVDGTVSGAVALGAGDAHPEGEVGGQVLDGDQPLAVGGPCHLGRVAAELADMDVFRRVEALGLQQR